jgi:hypothetical protein
MPRPLRISLGVVVVGLVLYLADLATRDCRIVLYVYDNCLWMGLRRHLGLPYNRFLRMGILEGVGIFLALILYLTFRFVFPPRRVTQAAPDSSPPLIPEPPRK